MNTHDWLDAYLLAKPGAAKDYKAEWGWMRYQVGGKLFAATLHTGAAHDSAYSDKDLLSLKCDPVLAELLRREHPEVLPGYYCSKHCWNSIDLGGALSEEQLRQMCDDSYALVVAKLTKKLQAELLAGR